MKLRWARQLKPRNENFVCLRLNEFEQTPEFYGFVREHVHHFTVVVDGDLTPCLGFKHPDFHIKPKKWSTEDGIALLRVMAREWQEGKREIFRIEVVGGSDRLLCSIDAERNLLKVTSVSGDHDDAYRPLAM
ncbi:unnamed protein product, partial [Mesorhabditis spiculigera]